MNIKETSLWKRAFDVESPTPETSSALRKIETAYDGARENAHLLAAEIAREMPSLTVHDVSHLDALWEIARDVAGEEIVLNPLEAYVFGGAVLVHDLGLGAAAYPGGRTGLESHRDWPDALALVLRSRHGRFPTQNELSEADSTCRDEAVAVLLRRLHAVRAEELGLVHWGDGEEPRYLFPDQAMREAFGGLIGQIAASHWWQLDDVSRRLPSAINPLPEHPADWSVDPLKLACLLRVSDAVHLDQRRAPALLRAVRGPSGESDLHWTFQGKLLKSVVEGDRVRFSSGSGFKRADAAAWWLGWELIQNADRELRMVDDLLVDLGRARFRARGVLGADDPRRLARLVRTDGWVPVDASLRVSDVASLVKRMGGAELYGNDPMVPLRELLQNGSDAVRARRILQNRAADWGEITVCIRASESGTASISVEDTGVGMTVETMTSALLDFGNSLWRSPRLLDAHPGLAGAGFVPTGRFGIGFFSVLMWGDHIEVASRSMNAGGSDARVLELRDGENSRPLIRPAAEQERPVDGGTTVTVRLRDAAEPERDGHWRALQGGEGVAEAVSAVAWLAPTLSVRVNVTSGDERGVAVQPDDWTEIPGTELLERVGARRIRTSGTGPVRADDFSSEARRLSVVRTETGVPIARMCVSPWRQGVVTVGGFRAESIPNVAGVLIGDRPNLARDAATPLIQHDEFVGWLNSQRELLSSVSPEDWHVRFAKTLLAYGCEIGELPICWDQDGRPVSRQRLTDYATEHDEVWFSRGETMENWLELHGFSENRADELDEPSEYFDVQIMPFDFESSGLPAPQVPALGRLTRVVEETLAKAWSLDKVKSQAGQLKLGYFEYEEVEVEGTVYKRPST